MMNVRHLLEKALSKQDVFVEGYLVYHEDGELSLIDSNYGNDYLKAPFVKITNDNLGENLERHVSLYGGGASRLFHYAKIKGFFYLSEEGVPLLNVIDLSVEDNEKWHSIDLSKRYTPRDNGGVNWHEIFKNDNE